MQASVVGPQMRGFTNRMRSFSTQTRTTQAAAIFVRGEDGVRTNSLLGPNKQYPLPGDVCHFSLREEQNVRLATPFMPLKVTKDPHVSSISRLLDSTRIAPDTNYLHELHDAALEEAQQKAGDWPIELSVQQCPRLLRKDLKHLFPDMDMESRKVSVLNLTQKSQSDMSAWSGEMEKERDLLTAAFCSSASAVCLTLRRCGYWADFIDPSSGRPYLGKFTNHALFETDDAYAQMGFKIEDLGCCKVLKHCNWGTNAFVGTMFTDAPLDSTIVQDILRKVNTDEEISAITEKK